VRHGQSESNPRLIHLLIRDLSVGEKLEKLFLLLSLYPRPVVLDDQVQDASLIADPVVVRPLVVRGKRLIEGDLGVLRIEIGLELPPIVQEAICLLGFLEPLHVAVQLSLGLPNGQQPRFHSDEARLGETH